jgi:hypothetical protein
MSEMNCTRAGRLMPLYVAGDLEATQARTVATHLAACEDCRALAAEFAASRSLLAEACELPEFGAEFYAGIRSAVLDEIKRDAATPTSPTPFLAPPSSFIAALFGRRLIYAASVALLLVACGLALYHVRRGTNEPPHEMARDGREQHEQSQPLPTRDSSPTPPRELEKREPAPRVVLASANTRNSRRLSGASSAVKHGITPRQTELAQTNIAPLASLPGVSRTAATTADAASQPAVEASRIEIQTADPNIRIIWLTPQKSEAPTPERDRHENGDTK